MITKIYLTFVFTLLFHSYALAHGGGLDKSGGHHDRKNGGYHCHKEPCFSNFQKSEDAVAEAKRESRPFSYVYKREDWKHWSDFDNDCMNTRHEILKAQSKKPAKLSPNGCYVSSGVWDDPYSGKTYTRASDLDIDHIIPLKWAHDHGGATWSASQKETFANDPDNLLAVDDALNQQKSAKGPDVWLPPNNSFRCSYIALWQVITKKYSDLKFTASEQRIFNKQITACTK